MISDFIFSPGNIESIAKLRKKAFENRQDSNLDSKDFIESIESIHNIESQSETSTAKYFKNANSKDSIESKNSQDSKNFIESANKDSKKFIESKNKDSKNKLHALYIGNFNAQHLPKNLFDSQFIYNQSTHNIESLCKNARKILD
ncbi:hypothetical protein DCO58_04280 [Helicobacter saguini]|nr:hypothetical protein [Helicobacter saguini]MWV62427.1 hypothetical protein [Helicobacter saguini]MWV66901.1 hypothetical protein [Helicobacter saguini]MWV69250.1 hypothetical protein [Helicobacter saguini]MWV71195.1 hypothetical protein [Helicobacter saguini]